MKISFIEPLCQISKRILSQNFVFLSFSLPAGKHNIRVYAQNITHAFTRLFIITVGVWDYQQSRWTDQFGGVQAVLWVFMNINGTIYWILSYRK